MLHAMFRLGQSLSYTLVYDKNTFLPVKTLMVDVCMLTHIRYV